MKTVAFVGGTSMLSRVGLGCARLTGGADRKNSTRVIEAAIDSGITHFDTAPSYGFGLSEGLLGLVIGADPQFTVATKVGIARPANGARLAVARRFLRPIAQRLSMLRRAMANMSVPERSCPEISPAMIAANLDESRCALRRDKVDVYLMHEPTRATLLNADVAKALDTLIANRSIGAYGVGVGNSNTPEPFIGTVEQSLWSASRANDRARPGTLRISHGLLRHHLPKVRQHLTKLGSLSKLSHHLDADLADPAALASIVLTAALALCPDEVFLVSSNDANRLRSCVGAVNWDKVACPDSAYLASARALLSPGSRDTAGT